MFTSSKRRKEELLANYFKIKKCTFCFDSIGEYFLKSGKSGAFQVITDKTYQDLNLDELFMFVDRTLSNVGQQFLYANFRTIPGDNVRCERFEKLILVLNADRQLKESVLEQLSKLGKNDAYYLPALFLEDHLPKPAWFWIVPVLSLVSVLSIFLSLFFSQFLLALIPVLGINYFIHYWNRGKFVQYSGAMLQLLILKQVAKEFTKAEILAENNEEMSKCITSIDSIGFQMSLFRLEAKLQSDMGQAIESLVDIIKALFLVEPIVLFNVLKEFDSKRKEIHQLFKLVGEVDVAISIDSLRKELPYYTVPTFTDKKKQLRTEDIFHPLLTDFVANSMKNDQKSVLLTGSNMSGKTTFIRTIGINAILAQTINTCFAREFVLPRLKVHSSIKISDDIMSDKSYYFEEVLTMKEMLAESRSGFQNLFLLDEIFKGTNTVERIAAGKSLLTYLDNGDNIVFVSTHDLEMTTYLKEDYSLYHFTEVVEHESILFDYKIKPGKLETTNAIRILALNRYPPELIAEAQKLSEEINKNKGERPADVFSE